VVEADGCAWATNDVNLQLELERGATMMDIWRACSEVTKDVEMSTIAQRVLTGLKGLDEAAGGSSPT
jgi:hypothetical protein